MHALHLVTQRNKRQSGDNLLATLRYQLILDPTMLGGLTVRHDVDGFIVDIKEAAKALADGHKRPVPGADVGVELQVSWHLAPLSQLRNI